MHLLSVVRWPPSGHVESDRCHRLALLIDERFGLASPPHTVFLYGSDSHPPPEIHQCELFPHSEIIDMRSYMPPRYRVMLVKESGAHAADVRISDSQKAHRFLAPLFDGLDREHFWWWVWLVCRIMA